MPSRANALLELEAHSVALLFVGGVAAAVVRAPWATPFETAIGILGLVAALGMAGVWTWRLRCYLSACELQSRCRASGRTVTDLEAAFRNEELPPYRARECLTGGCLPSQAERAVLDTICPAASVPWLRLVLEDLCGV